MSQNPFLRDIDYYVRELAPFSQYKEQMAFYLHRMTGQPLEDTTAFVQKQAGKDLKDPVIHHFERNDFGDRGTKSQPLSRYIGTICNERQILVPTGTTYLPPDVKLSYISGFITKNKKIRSKAKKEAQAAEAAGNMDLAVFKNNEQVNKKTFNNSCSGAFATKSSVLYNPTGHNTLTSITRTVSSLGNATNEKIISGNRHYHRPDVTLNNLICIAQAINYSEVHEAMTKYDLHYPTVEETIRCIKYSTDLYWNDPKAFQPIQDFVERLLPIERAAVVYSSDLYHLRLLNPEFIRTFLLKLSKKVTDVQNPHPEPTKAIWKFNEQYVGVAHHICMSFTAGKGKDYEEKFSNEEMQVLVATCANIENVILEYRDFIAAFFLTKVLPASTAHIANMRRRAVVLSDTDSTMFSIDEWVIWQFGQICFHEEAMGFAAGVMLFTTQCIAHALATFSANMGVERSKLFLLEMKPEFTFPVFAQTSVAKHYYTCRLVKEGNVFVTPKMEIKGVYLKNSAAPKVLIDASQAEMENILMSVYNGKGISLGGQITRVADIERKIKTGLLNGDMTYYKFSKVKEASAYGRGPTESPYQYHDFWNRTFGLKYGVFEEPPYTVIKLPTTIRSPSKMREWLDSFEDQQLAGYIRAWMAERNKKTIKTFYLSIAYVSANGIPVELQRILDHKKVALDLTTTDRMMLESLGYYSKHKRLLSEMGY